VVAAIEDQLHKLAFAHTAFFTNEPQEELARRLAVRFGDPGSRVYFTSGGSEANETALKLAWQYWAAHARGDKKIIISREHSYHGNTFGVLSASGNPGRRRMSAAPLIDWPRIPPCYEYREREPHETPEAYGQRAADYLEAAIVRCGADRVAAFICEPVVGSSLGVVAAAPGYLARIREICDRHDVLLIADEIMCGSGRTGEYFAHSFDGIRPDIVTLAKGIGGGYQPLAAVVLGKRVATTLSNSGFAHGYTYIGHAAACAAGLAVQTVIDRDDLLSRTRRMGKMLLAMLRESIGDHPMVGDIRGRGLFAAIELVSDRQSRAGFERGGRLPDQLRLTAMEEGLLVYPGGFWTNERFVPHIMLAPPMIADEEQLRACTEIVQRVIGRVVGGA
jgi:adenosylmethionine-8-amino-7-oxononanoate aminotransferase